MATGVLVFEGMKIGVLPGDMTIEVNEDGAVTSKLILSTAYNILPIWIRIANDELLQARQASTALKAQWGTNDQINRELLVAELEPSLQVFVACGISLDALYDQLRPFAKLTEADLQKWKDNRTGRDKQIVEVVRRVYKLDALLTSQFKLHISEIIKYRDMAVHPSLELKQTCTRPDVPVGVDWKFSAYRCSNAETCFKATMQMLIHLYERECDVANVVDQMEHVFKALEELKVITRNAVA
ncbi:MAG TPA: hypothetical protein VN283_04990 [Thiobacillus sp.]|nr:hypothetical protein [Thiobacillus sp.]